jgi:drug/metabolite transporter (DMT)-like permease
VSATRAPARERALATLTLVGAALGFASITIFTLLATATGAPLLTVLFFRYAIAAVILFPVGGIGRVLRLPGRRIAALAVVAGIGQAGVSWLSLSALAYIPAATLVFLFYTYASWIAIIAAVRGTERIDRLRAAALTLSFFGVVLMVGMPGSGTLHPAGAGLALASALLYAIYVQVVSGLQRGLTPAVTSAWITVGVAVIFCAVGLAAGELTFRLNVVAWTNIVAIASLATAVPFLLFLRGLSILGPVRTAIVSTIEPFFVTILAALVLHQPVTLAAVAGGVLIAIAVLILHRAPPASEPAAIAP